MRIWDKALTQKEIQTNLNLELSDLESNLVNYYDFNDVIGTNVYDGKLNIVNPGVYDFRVRSTEAQEFVISGEVKSSRSGRGRATVQRFSHDFPESGFHDFSAI